MFSAKTFYPSRREKRSFWRKEIFLCSHDLTNLSQSGHNYVYNFHIAWICVRGDSKIQIVEFLVFEHTKWGKMILKTGMDDSITEMKCKLKWNYLYKSNTSGERCRFDNLQKWPWPTAQKVNFMQLISTCQRAASKSSQSHWKSNILPTSTLFLFTAFPFPPLESHPLHQFRRC